MYTSAELSLRLEGQPPEVVDAMAGIVFEGLAATGESGSAGARALRDAMHLLAKALQATGLAELAAMSSAGGVTGAGEAAMLTLLQEAIERARLAAFRALPDDEQFERIAGLYAGMPVGDPRDADGEAAWQAAQQVGVRKLTGAELRARRAAQA